MGYFQCKVSGEALSSARSLHHRLSDFSSCLAFLLKMMWKLGGGLGGQSFWSVISNGMHIIDKRSLVR